MGQWREDGCIVFQGRNDFQVKIRGFRIELGEIESRIQQLPGVKEAVVTARKDDEGDTSLVAYLVLGEGSPNLQGQAGQQEDADLDTLRIRSALLAALPAHMIPSAFVRLAALPLTPNGKVDRKALPAPRMKDLVRQTYEEPEGEVEITLASIWSDQLKTERIGRHDDFFELGGHSLMVIQVIDRIRQAFGVDATPASLFEHRTIARLSDFIVDQLLQQYSSEDLAEMSREIAELSDEEVQHLIQAS